MNMKSHYLLLLSGVALVLAVGTAYLTAQADDPVPETTAVVKGAASEPTVAQQEQDPTVAAAAQEGQQGINKAAIYDQLKQLGKEYREARSQDAKQRIVNRANDLMSQLFDAKVQREQRRIDALQRRLNEEQNRLHEMQTHKQDLVHQGVQRALDTGELPDWAAPANRAE
jgi:hypothetical protein